MKIETDYFIVEHENDEFIDWITKALDESYLELTKLFNKKLPKMPIIIFKSQKEFHSYFKKNHKSWVGDEPWFIAWSNNGPGNKPILLASPSDWSERPKPRTYIQIKQLIKHELVHRFTDRKMPFSMHEGIACFIAEQKKSEKRLRERFKTEKNTSLYGVSSFILYLEAPFFIKWLVNEFGIEKLISFIKKDSEFENDFKEIYNKSFTKLEEQWKKEFVLIEMVKIPVSKKEVEKKIPEQWQKLSDYLNLNLSFEDMLNYLDKEMKKRGKKFSFEVKETEGWAINVKSDEKESKWNLSFVSKVKSEKDLNRKIMHELIHVYQHVYQDNLFKIDRELKHEFKEAVAKIISNKLSKEGEIIDHLTNEEEVNKIIRRYSAASDEEIKELFFLPERVNDLKKLEEKIKKLKK